MSRTPCIGGPLDGQQIEGLMLHFGVDGSAGEDSYGYSREEFQGMRFFVVDTMGFLAARREMRRLWHAEFSLGAGIPLGSELALSEIRRLAERLVANTRNYGVVLTITQRPLQPLGQAHYETVVEVRPVQVPT